MSFIPTRILRAIFPPYISGLTIFLIGASLIGSGVRVSLLCSLELLLPDVVPPVALSDPRSPKRRRDCCVLQDWGGGTFCQTNPGFGCGVGESNLTYGAPSYWGLGFFVVVVTLILELFGSPFMRSCQVKGAIDRPAPSQGFRGSCGKKGTRPCVLPRARRIRLVTDRTQLPPLCALLVCRRLHSACCSATFSPPPPRITRATDMSLSMTSRTHPSSPSCGPQTSPLGFMLLLSFPSSSVLWCPEWRPLVISQQQEKPQAWSLGQRSRPALFR